MTEAFQARQGESSALTAGDLWTWRRDDLAGTYPPVHFALSYVLTPEEGGAPATINGTEDADGYLVSAPPATSATYAPARYVWRALVTRSADSARATVGSGAFTVAPDSATSAADTRSIARRILAALEARLEGRITKDAESYTIKGWSIT